MPSYYLPKEQKVQNKYSILLCTFFLYSAIIVYRFLVKQMIYLLLVII